jgi:protein-S-isoprenylcysteine O-methyltransferase Ste14
MIVSILILLATLLTHIDLPVWLKVIGYLLFILGLITCTIAFFQLGSSFTPFVKPKEQGDLKTTGIYSIVRHPMYLGVMMLAFGWSLIWGTLLGIILSFLFFFVLDRKASEEEKLLTQKYFEYIEYKKHVKKMIPFIY